MTTARTPDRTPATPRTSRIPRRPAPDGRSHRCVPRVLTHPHVVGGIVACTVCGRMADVADVPPQRVA